MRPAVRAWPTANAQAFVRVSERFGMGNFAFWTYMIVEAFVRLRIDTLTSPSMTTTITMSTSFVEPPDTSLGFVDPGLDHAGGSRVPMLAAQVMDLA